MNTQALYLSAGQLRRLSLSEIIIESSPFWILDEPMTSLDADGQQLLSDLLDQHLTNGGMAILATHQCLSLKGNMKTIDLGDHMFNSLLTIIRHEILTTLRQAFSWLTPLLFFVIVVCLFPLALGPDDLIIK